MTNPLFTLSPFGITEDVYWQTDTGAPSGPYTVDVYGQFGSDAPFLLASDGVSGGTDNLTYVTEGAAALGGGPNA